MTRSRSPLSPETRALLDRERAIPSQPVTVRARALARARASLPVGALEPAAAPPATAPAPRWAVAAALACVASAAIGAAAYGIRARGTPAPVVAPLARPIGMVARTPVREAPDEPAAPVEDQSPAPPPAGAGAAPRLSSADALRAELHLLRLARAAVAREDFAAALRPIAEHARRFDNGRLTEEREALRVKALAGLGRTDEARRASASFRQRFPHSVLLSAVERISTPGPAPGRR